MKFDLDESTPSLEAKLTAIEVFVNAGSEFIFIDLFITSITVLTYPGSTLILDATGMLLFLLSFTNYRNYNVK